MPRIRSVHPGFWNDENYVSLSIAARLFLIGILTDADDHGVFEWKPITLKMRLFPADSIDVVPLLDELVAANVVAKREHSGKSFGLVRNFCKWQKPKNPSYRHEFPNDWAGYVAFKGACAQSVSSRTESLPQGYPSAGVNGAQMEEGVEEYKENESWEAVEWNGNQDAIELPSVADTQPRNLQTEAQAFDAFWSVYPTREGPNPKKPAAAIFAAALKKGVPAETLVGCARACADDLRKAGKLDTSFVAQAKTWLREERWVETMPKLCDPEQDAKTDRDMARKGYVWSENRWQLQKMVPKALVAGG